jgi:ribulose 1,5-bisphosphate synthetase/thiazole synthase
MIFNPPCAFGNGKAREMQTGMPGRDGISPDIIREPARDTPVARNVDVVVCGGGLSGIGAALGAARSGARTLLVERHAWLGGPATATLMNTWNVPVERMTGVAREIAQSLHQRGAGVAGGPTFPFDPEAFKELAVDLIEDAGAEILTYSWVCDAIVDDGTVRGIIVQNKSGRQAILARTVVDTTGDADVASLSGAECVKGREKDGMMRPVSVLFRLGGVDVVRAVDYCRSNPQNFTADPNFHILQPERGLVRMSGFFDIAEKARASGKLPDEIHYIRMEGVSVERGVVMVNNSRVYGVDGTDAWELARADREARRQNRMLLDVIRNHIPGFENSWVMDSSSSVGVRETRRIRAPLVVTRSTGLPRQT